MKKNEIGQEKYNLFSSGHVRYKNPFLFLLRMLKKKK